MRKQLLAAAALIALIPPAFASSGSYVLADKVDGQAAAYCDQFIMKDDGNPTTWAAGVVYGFSLRDPGAGIASLKLQISELPQASGVMPSLFFTVGGTGAGLNPSDCPASLGITYVTGVHN